MRKKMCVLDDSKECDHCLECEICDLNRNKICDNCGKCLEIHETATIHIDGIYLNPDDVPEKYR